MGDLVIGVSLIFVCLPLLIFNVSVSIYIYNRNGRSPLLKWMWLPVICMGALLLTLLAYASAGNRSETTTLISGRQPFGKYEPATNQGGQAGTAVHERI